jgi:SAM-dependent methyltransferase
VSEVHSTTQGGDLTDARDHGGGSVAGASSADSAARVLELIHAGWTSQAVCAMVELQLADHLAAQAHTGASLALACGCDEGALGRLLRALQSLELLQADDEGLFGLTSLGRCLRSRGGDSLSAQALWFARHSWTLWAGLTDSVRSGRTVRDRQRNQTGYRHLEADVEAAQVFNQAMVQLTRLVAASVAARCDFEGVREIIDVGGGHGELLAACLAACPQARGRVLEMAHAVPGARSHLAAAGLAGRAVAEVGDFFADIPTGADLVLLKAVLHNWDDAHCAEILQTVRRALPPQGRLLVVERVVPEPVLPTVAHRMVMRSDLNMLIGVGGLERTAAEFKRLLQEAGFELLSVMPTVLGFSAIESRRGS